MPENGIGQSVGTWIARVTIVLCLFGAAVPLYFAGPPAWTFRGVLLGSACILIPGAIPFLLLGCSVWVCRRNTVAALALAIATVLAVLVGLWEWNEASQDPKGLDLLTAIVVVPPIQIALWGAVYGASMAHRLAHKAAEET